MQDTVKSPSSKRPKLKKDTVRKNEPRSFSSTAPYISTFVLLIAVLLIYDLVVVAQSDVDFSSLKTDLLNNVHNQSEAVNIVIESLDKLQKDEKSVYLNFVGSTGVGKTFVANIIKKYFQPSVYELNSELKIDQFLYKLKFSGFKYNLVVAEDLNVLDTDKVVNFIQKIPQDFVVFVISIFNIQETDQNLKHEINYNHVTVIKEKMNFAQTILFKEFNNEQVSDWIAKQLVLKCFNVENHSEVVETLVKDQNVKYHGLKGLSSKINLQLC